MPSLGRSLRGTTVAAIALAIIVKVAQLGYLPLAVVRFADDVLLNAAPVALTMLLGIATAKLCRSALRICAGRCTKRST